MAELQSASPGRAQRLLRKLSDPTSQPAAVSDKQAACGASPRARGAG